MTMQQRQWRHILEALGREQIHARLAVEGGQALAAQIGIVAEFPDLAAGDAARNAAALGQIAAAAGGAHDRDLISRATAVRLIAMAAGQIGVTLDPEQELARGGPEGV